MTERRYWRSLAAAAAVLVVILLGVAIGGQSLIGDAPYHLLAGHQALRYGQNSLNLEHPPLVKMLAALPLLAEEPVAPPLQVRDAVPTALRLYDDGELLARLRWRSRLLLTVLFALPLLGVCVLLGRELAGRRAGVLLGLTLGLSFNVLPYLPVLQTDTAVSLGYALTALAALRYLRSPTAARAALVGAGWGLALAAKFSGVLLGPAVLLTVVLGTGNWRRRTAHAVLAGLVASVLLGATYGWANRDYDARTGRETLRQYCRGAGSLRVGERLRPWQPRLLALERHSPFLAQWSTGFLGIRAQDALGVYPSYAFGRISYEGRWWYFPVVFAVKTPLALLAALAAAAFAAWRGRRGPPSVDRRAVAVLGTIAAVYLAVAMRSNYNLGMRHLLPVMPFLLLPAVLWAARDARRAAALVVLLALESVALVPRWMSATNTWWLGDRNPTRTALSNSNYEAHQNFIALGRAAAARDVGELRVLHPWTTPAELGAYLPSAVLVGPDEDVRPGWYAVNNALEQYVPAILEARPGELRDQATWTRLARRWQPVWQRVREAGEDHGDVAGTFRLYQVSPPRAAAPP